MREVRATVERVADGKVWLRVPNQAGGCGRCHEPGGCGAVRLTDLFKGMNGPLVLPDRFGVVEGQSVWLGVPEQVPLRAALLCYALPLAFGLAGGALGGLAALSGHSDIDVLAGLVVGLAGGWRLVQRRLAPESGGRRQAWSVRPADESRRGCGE
ncbi:MAG: SoxR reducing system RseC family protein [Zoogloeaceae bacterium]|nr:SoxR reducing system RseC family protein [Zoogloeaceae bacterium]